MPLNVIPFEKAAIFIDGWNLARVSRDYLRREIDFERLLNYFSRNARIIKAFYYIGEDTEDGENAKQHKFLTWMKRNGYKVVSRPIKVYVDDKGKYYKKADLDADITLDMMDLADKVDKIVLFSGDGDFANVIDRIGMKGVRTQVVALWDVASGDLVEAADEFLDLKDIINEIAKV